MSLLCQCLIKPRANNEDNVAPTWIPKLAQQCAKSCSKRNQTHGSGARRSQRGFQNEIEAGHGLRMARMVPERPKRCQREIKGGRVDAKMGPSGTDEQLGEGRGRDMCGIRGCILHSCLRSQLFTLQVLASRLRWILAPTRGPNGPNKLAYTMHKTA